MDRLFGFIGIFVILGICYLMSNNRKAIDLRLVGVGLLLQWGLAIFVLKVPLGKQIFQTIGHGIEGFLKFAMEGAEFVFGFLAQTDKLGEVIAPLNANLFFLNLMPAVIFIAVLVNIAYHLGIMQKIVSVIAKAVNFLMGASGSESLSNVSSAFVGQIEAQLMIKPYVSGMTKSELLASMTGSMACIAGGIMAVYISMGVQAEYLLAASIMAAPGALVISKIVYPETEESETKGKVKLEVKKNHVNLIDAISHGACDGMRISINIIALLIAFIALIAMIDAILGGIGSGIVSVIGHDITLGSFNLSTLSMKDILGGIFSILAYAVGVPFAEAQTVGALMGTKVVLNEFVAYIDLTSVIKGTSDIVLSQKSIAIASFALCGFANISSIGMQVGGIGEIAPNRRKDLAQLGVKALICGSLTSYMSAAIAGILL